jgi:hypothetical protein
MGSRNIIVIGASAGGFDALKRLVADLPGDLQASIAQPSTTWANILARRAIRTATKSGAFQRASKAERRVRTPL